MGVSYLRSPQTMRREGVVSLGTYLRKNSRQGPQAPAPQPEREAMPVKGAGATQAACFSPRLGTGD